MGAAGFLQAAAADAQCQISIALPDSRGERLGELCYTSRAASLRTAGDENNPSNNHRAQLLHDDASLQVVQCGRDVMEGLCRGI